MPAKSARLSTLAVVTAGGVALCALLAGCSSAEAESTPANASPSLPMSTPTPSPTGADASSAPEESTSPTPSAPAAKPADPVDPAYTVADAIMDQLNTIPPASLTSELVVIAVSPQLRQVTEQYGVTSGIDVKGANVSVTIESKKLRCSVTVSDPPETMLALTCKKR